MSMPALLSHFGINTARFVTTTGEVVFGGVTSTRSGAFTHATLASVTPVANHTFHGGEEVPDQGPDGPTAWWDQDDQVIRHVEAMKRAFPYFTYIPADNDLAPSWIGEINTGRGRFKIAVVLRRDRGLPSVRVVNGPRLGANAGGTWVPSPHLYLNGNLCVADRDDWNPDEHTAATVTAWAAHWLAAYTEWRMSRRWPAEGVQSVAL
jgi:hypothetical protein